MSIDIGIIGLAKSGKTVIFNALTRGKVDNTGHSPESSAQHIGVTRILDSRLNVLTELLHSCKMVPVEAKYIDTGASLRGPVNAKGIGGELLNQLGNVDTLINVVRAFTDDSIPHVEGSLDIKRDITAMDLELAFSDLAIIERRIERIETFLKGAKPSERQVILKEQEMLTKFKAKLEQDIPVREMEISPGEARIIANYQLLTVKHLLIVVNIGEEQLAGVDSLETELSSGYLLGKRRVIALCGKLEMELAQLDESAAREFRAEYGLKESGLERIIRLSYELLGLISFFTTVSNEVRAWSIRRGTTALNAAGKIHSDMERGFIRAEVINCDDLVEYGGFAEARKRGRLRLEGKDYIIQDGDVITFLFNV